MRKIYKYDLAFSHNMVTTIKAPIEQILDIQWQPHLGPMMWAIVDDEKEDIEIDLICIGTGLDIPEEVEKYIGTIQTPSGYVWHYFTYKIKELIQAPTDREEMVFYDNLAVLAKMLGQAGITHDEAAEQFCKLLTEDNKEKV